MSRKHCFSASPVILIALAALSAPPAAALEDSLGFSVQDGNASGGERAQVTMRVTGGDRDGQVFSARAEGVQVAPGFRGAKSIIMREAEYRRDPSTDLLLHFNAAPEIEAGPGYAVEKAGLAVSGKVRRMGPAAALFNADRQGLVLRAQEGSLFQPGTFWGDFSIEFWLYPTTMDEGEQILAWDGSTWLDGNQKPQSIRIALKDHRMTLDFINFFVRLAPGGNRDEGRNILEASRFTLRNKREILPRVWQHHLLRFNSRSCALEYLIDGKIEDIAYATASRHQGGQPYRPYLGETSEPRLRIGAKLTGFLDELRISRSRVEAAQTDSFDDRGSYVIFNPIDFRDIGVGSKVFRIDAQYQHPGTSDVAFYYKMANLPNLALRDDSAWIRFRPGEDIAERNQGQYLYFKVELLPDGSGAQGPSFQSLTVNYRPDPPPPPPGGVVAVPRDGAILLRWNPVPVMDLRGYLVYYGTRPGQYFGAGASIGASPANIGKPELKDGAVEVLVGGLDNGRLYYFSVASYNVSNDPIYGLHLKRSQSKEVSARPAR